MNNADPIQSIRRSFWTSDWATKLSLKKRAIMMNPIVQSGRLIQNIHTHDAAHNPSSYQHPLLPVTSLSSDAEIDTPFCARPPPTMGPATVPSAQTLFSTPNHFPRCLSGMRSVIRISLSATTPPPPTPCRVRPTIKTVKFLAMAAIMEPTVKNTKAMIIFDVLFHQRPRKVRKETTGALHEPKVYDRRCERVRRNWAGRRWR